ncbi:MAG: ATP-binding protein [Bacteroidota bacterium]
MIPPGAPHGRVRGTVFWKVAGVLVGAQVATGLLAVALSAWFAQERGLDLAAGSLRLRLNTVAEEIEARLLPTATPLDSLPPLLRLDLALRFPDPLHLLDAEGRLLETILPDSTAFETITTGSPPLPDFKAVLDTGAVVVQLQPAEGAPRGVAPLYDVDGALLGGVAVYPLDQSLTRELAGTQAAYRRALGVVGALACAIALLLGGAFTWGLVRPLRRITSQIEQVGAGEYGTRLTVDGDDEFDRLGASVNRMAEQVEDSMKRLQATDTLRRELIANVGHDLRTPLAALRGYLEEATRHLADDRPEPAGQALRQADRQRAYLERLVADLFELSLLDTVPPPLRRDPTPLAELLTDAARRHRVAATEHGVQLITQIPATLPILHGDALRLLRMLDNLLSNALRHTPAGGQVTLAATAQATAVQVAVTDTGPGLTDEEAARVFERYYRGTEARTRADGRTGLGLAISRAVAQAHGGDLSVTATPGQGATFTVRLPIEAS